MARSINFTDGVLFKASKNRSIAVTSTGMAKDIDNDSDRQKIHLVNPTGSFRFDPIGNPLKSTQQLNIDFSRFENHTFFNSARSKVHITFDKILNTYPFDGSFRETVEFLDSLTGFEKYVFDQVPKNTGFLRFSGSMSSSAPSAGNYIQVSPFRGAINPDNKTFVGEDKLALNKSPFTIEFCIFVPTGSNNDCEVITQRISPSGTGFTIALSSSVGIARPFDDAPMFFGFSSGSSGDYFKLNISKGVFQNVSMVFDRGGSDKVSVYTNGELQYRSDKIDPGSLKFDGASLNIGSGSTHLINSTYFTPERTLSGALDEFRFFTEARKLKLIKRYKNKSIFAEPNLKLYYRFNEPSGAFDLTSNNSSLVLDYSGNALHSKVTNFLMSHRNPKDIKAALNSERSEFSPVLFPSFLKVSQLATRLVLSGADYDYNNPNLITKLIPQHYLAESALVEGLLSDDQNLDASYTYTEDQPGKAKIPSAQIISSILYLWADKFDEIKLFIDEFSRFLKVDYQNTDSISDQMLPHLAKYWGFEMPTIFKASTEEQFIDGDSIALSESSGSLSLRKIQSTVWRRILSDMSNIVRKKGTHDSVKAIFRNMGINPSSPYKIKEYGGSVTSKIKDSYESREKNLGMVYFSGSNSAGTLRADGVDTRRPTFISPFLFGSRVETGAPAISGTVNDGLFTSGSWGIEATYKISPKSTPITQSLIRIHTTGSRSDASSNNYITYNLLATRDNKPNGSKGRITLMGKPAPGPNAPVLSMSLGVNIFDGNNWTICFGRVRSDFTGSFASSSYYLKAGRTGLSGLTELHKTESYFDDSGNNTLNYLSSSNNASGSFVAIGKMVPSYDSGNTQVTHLNDYSTLSSETSFTGRVRGIRFYSKAISDSEFDTHARNPNSVGVDDPMVGSKFTLSESGSFERIRMDISADQPSVLSDASGELEAFDFSQNLFHGKFTGFKQSSRVINPVTFNYQILSPKFENGINSNKIRPRSFQDPELIKRYGVELAPVWRFNESEMPMDDRRVGVEISIAQQVNDDIVNVLSSLDFFNTAIGDPTQMFSQEYRDLRSMRRVYFERLKNKVDTKKFFEFYRWFDVVVGDIIEELIPSTSRYIGTNFVVESHALERHKIVYNFQEMYVGESDKTSSEMFLQQFVARVRRY